MVEAIAMWLGAGWFGYKWFVKRQIKYIVLPLSLIMNQLTRWPLFLDYHIVFGLLGIVGAIIMGVEFAMKKQMASMYPYVVLLLFISGLLLVEPLHHYII